MGSSISKLLDPWLRGSSLLDEFDYLCKGRFLPFFVDPDFYAARPVYRAADDLISTSLVHRFGLPGNHGFIDGCLTLYNHAVDGNLFSRSHKENVSHLHIGGLDLNNLPVFNQIGRGWDKLHKLPQRP